MIELDKTCVIRFGALGDLCICGWFISSLAQARPETRISLVTKPEYLPLAKAFRGVEQVLTPQSNGIVELIRFSAILREMEFDYLIDAHSVLRSTLLWAAWRRIPDSRLHKETLSRLLLITLRRLGCGVGLPGLKHPLLDRFRTLDPLLSEPIIPTADKAPLFKLRREPGSHDIRIALAPGARWPLKMWPMEKYRELCEILLQTPSTLIDVFLGPWESNAFRTSSLSRLADKEPRIHLCMNLPLPDAAARLALCQCLLTNDSGLLHLAEATGTPVIAIFGPTTREFGYFPLLPDSRTVEMDLPCRPCSRTGSGDCYRGDHACLMDLPTESVYGAVSEVLGNLREGTP